MRTFVHLLLLVCAVAVAVGAFGPLIGTLEPRHVQLTELRDGFPAGRSLEQIQAQSVTLQTSLAVVILGVAAVLLLATLFGSRLLGWLAVLVGLATVGVLAWRLDSSFDKQIRADYHQLFSGTWGLYAVGGGVIVALLCLLVPRERRAF
ncbi:hypothetical protein [Nocardia macrotermitis]|uniref:Uncharacterized protein n=1 Tax=Nocardia macrotermitis TaxID=2585198 RepID=A0A7K0CW94_9NOCA|nr:hypothetical protein [Nocardia macrotermitis]MQY17653.1 hypothetical protein [Nocardia macrotermitis]